MDVPDFLKYYLTTLGFGLADSNDCGSAVTVFVSVGFDDENKPLNQPLLLSTDAPPLLLQHGPTFSI